MNHYFNMYLKKAYKPIKVASVIGAISGSISGVTILSKYCSDNMSLDLCENNYANSQVAASAIGTIAGGASGIMLGAAYPALKTFIGWCYHMSEQVMPVELEEENNSNHNGLNI